MASGHANESSMALPTGVTGGERAAQAAGRKEKEAKLVLKIGKAYQCADSELSKPVCRDVLDGRCVSIIAFLLVAASRSA